MHKVCEFYKKIYLLSSKIPKKDRFGIYLKIENICIDVVNLTIEASLEIKNNKLPKLNCARTEIEILKRLVRIIYELNLITNNQYIELESNLQEISKMTSGWIKYLK